MRSKNMSMFYISAVLAITGAVGYQYFVKRVPGTLNPIISVMAMYIVILVLSMILLSPQRVGFVTTSARSIGFK